MHQEDAQVIAQHEVKGGYKLLEFHAPRIAPEVRPGQFVHLLVPHLGESVLRRPFSVFKAGGDTLCLLYKDVGRGTHALVHVRPGERVSLIGPLGNGYPQENEGSFPVLVAGGYGMAALYLVASSRRTRGIAFFGGRKEADILCVPEFEALGWEVVVSTEDGSLGTHGIVTDALDPWMARREDAARLEFFVCGPNRMLRAVGERASRLGRPAWLSVDRPMGCGVGACLTCVLRVRDEEADTGWSWARACREGPVFEAREVLWDE